MDITTSIDGIISEFDDWARRQRRQVDTPVIERLLAARPASSGSPRQVWRSGDVAHAVDAALEAAPVVFLLAAEPLEETLDVAGSGTMSMSWTSGWTSATALSFAARDGGPRRRRGGVGRPG